MTALEVSGLKKSYGELHAVVDVSFRVEQGEIFGLLGPNGAGKTTTIRMLCGLLRPDAGSVLLNGTPLQKRGAGKQTGLCPQEIVLYDDLSCIEQLVFMGRMYNIDGKTARKRGEIILQALGLEAKRDALARTLSGGMQRRLNIALAMIHEPQLLILDEPQAGLDPQSRVLVREYIHGIAGTTTVIITTHDMEEADKLASCIGIMDQGNLLLTGSPDTLKQNFSGSGGGNLAGTIIEAVLKQAVSENIRRDIESRLTAALSGSTQGRSRSGDTSTGGTTMKLSVRNNRVQLKSPEGVKLLPALFAALDSTGLEVEDASFRRPTLEDVFIGLTGRGLRE